MKIPTGEFRRLLLPVGLFVLAFVVRVIGMGWGLANELHNQSYHPDEVPIWAASQQVEPARFHFTPGFYNYGTLYLTCLRISSDMVAAYTGDGTPATAPTDADSAARAERDRWAYVSRCHEAGRFLNVLAGAGSVVFLFLILTRFVGSLAGVAGGLALTFAPAHVVHSRFQTVDIFAAFLLAGSAYFALLLVPITKAEPLPKVPDPGHDEATPAVDAKTYLRYLYLSAALAGLSAGTKYTGVVGLLTLWAVLFLCHRGRFLRDSLTSLLVCVVAFLVATPGAILDTARFREGLEFEFLHSGSGHGLVFAGTSSGYIYHLTNLATGMGGLVLLLGLGGIAFGTYRRYAWAIALLSFFVPYYLLIGHAQDKYMRYTFPLDLALAAGFGYIVAAGHRRKGAGHVVTGLGILALGGALAGTAKDTIFMTSPDPRDRAARYLKDASATDPKTVVGLASDPWYWTPPLFPDSAEPRAVPMPKRREQMAAVSSPHLALYEPTDGTPPHAFDRRLVTETKPSFVVYSSLEAAPLDRLSDESGLSGEAAAATQQYKDFLSALRSNDVADKQFGGGGDIVEDMMYIQPSIYVWKRKPTP